MKSRIKQLVIIMIIGLIILGVSSYINGEMNLNNFLIFLSGGILGLVLGSKDDKNAT